MHKRKRDKFYVELGFRVYQNRLLKCATQEELGERLGVSKQTVQRYECGEIHMPPEAIFKCAKALGVSVGHLYGEDHHQTAHHANVNRMSLTVAAEIMKLPDDNIRKGFYMLATSINRAFDQDETGQQNACMED